MPSFGLRKDLVSTYEDALVAVPEALKSEGFGVLTEVDVRQTLKNKLDVEFRPYKILGACNPPLAHRALQAELGAGLMMPCNVVVYQGDDRRAVVLAIDPLQTPAVQQTPALREVALEVRRKLELVLEHLR